MDITIGVRRMFVTRADRFVRKKLRESLMAGEKAGTGPQSRFRAVRASGNGCVDGCVGGWRVPRSVDLRSR
jgi:hypothetical protein